MQMPDLSIFSPYEAEFLPDEELGKYAYSLCGGPCKGLFRIDNGEMLLNIAKVCIRENLPFRVLGGISNVLISENGYDGIVLLNRGGEIMHKSEISGKIHLTADSGVSMAAIVRYCAENGISGFEWAAGLPGTLGGAVHGNAGAFGSEIADSFECAEVLDICGTQKNLKLNDMKFAYRTSAFKSKQMAGVLLGSTFLLRSGDPSEIRENGEKFREKRRNSQPYTENSLGSVFKNPEGYSAGKLIQDAGLKGKAIGNAVVSNKHANFITTKKGVRGSDYLELIRFVEKTVFEQSGIRLEPEIELLGF